MSSGLSHTLEKQGYCVIKNLLDQELIDKLTVFSDNALQQVSAAHRAQFKSQGSLINIADYPQFSEIIGHQALSDLFKKLQFKHPVFSIGSIISKPPFSPALFWHQDWWGWDHDVSYSAAILQVNIMIYLTATAPENGCLRVLPGSHRHCHPLHNQRIVYSEALCRVQDPNDALYQSYHGERAVPVLPGDVVVSDARMFHGAYANASAGRRTLLSLNFHPNFSALPASMRARILDIFCRGEDLKDCAKIGNMTLFKWPERHRRQVENFFPDVPQPGPLHQFNHQPDPLRLAKGEF